MSESQNKLSCPACGQVGFQFHTHVKDNFLTQEDFTLEECISCGQLATYPMPGPDLISKYYESDQYYSHGVEKKGFHAFFYRLVKKYNLGWKVRQLNKLKRNTTFLDFGCGTGDLISRCQNRGFQVRGSEPDSDARELAPANVKDLISTPEDELASGRKYDIISLWHVLEHVYRPDETMALLRDKLSHGGTMVIALPNPAAYDAQHYKEYWSAWDVPRHLWHFYPKNIIQLMERLGMKHVETHPQWFDSYHIALFSERYIDGNPVSAIFWATISNIRSLFAPKRTSSSQVYIFRLP